MASTGHQDIGQWPTQDGGQPRTTGHWSAASPGHQDIDQRPTQDSSTLMSGHWSAASPGQNDIGIGQRPAQDIRTSVSGQPRTAASPGQQDIGQPGTLAGPGCQPAQHRTPASPQCWSAQDTCQPRTDRGGFRKEEGRRKRPNQGVGKPDGYPGRGPKASKNWPQPPDTPQTHGSDTSQGPTPHPVTRTLPIESGLGPRRSPRLSARVGKSLCL